MAKCIVCGGKADLLCDHHLGWERKRGQMQKEVPNLALLAGHHVPLRFRKLHTCDAPLCDACAVRSGVMHIRMRGGSFTDSTDYCPGHPTFGTMRVEITGLQAEAFRAEWRAKYRKERERQENKETQTDLFGG